MRIRGIQEKMSRLMAFMTAFVVIYTHGSVYAHHDHNKVLVLSSYNVSYKWTRDLLEEIDAEFDPDPTTEVFFEHLDAYLFTMDEVTEPFRIYLREKYSVLQPEVIISVDDNALDFLKAYRDELFPGVPIVFCGVNNFTPARIEGESNITGQSEVPDIDGTIDIALRQNPRATKLVVIYDRTPTGLSTYELCRKMEEKFQSRVTFEYWTEMTFKEIESRLAQLQTGTLVLPLNYVIDVANVRKTSEDYINLIVANSPVPVYNLWQHNLGIGVVGGKMIDPKQHAHEAVVMAKQILAGAKADAIPVNLVCPSEFFFDYAAMQRFGITGPIPQESVVINRPYSIYQNYKIEIWTAMISFIMLGGLVVVLYTIAMKKNAALRLAEENEKQFRTLFEYEPDAIVMGEPQERVIIDANIAATKLFGLSKKSLIGMRYIELFAPSERETCRENYRRFLAGDYPYHEPFKTICQRADGVEISVELIAQWVQIKGNPYIMGIFHDITEHVKAEKERQRLIASLKEKTADMQRFLYIVSHDLRAPLLNIGGFGYELISDISKVSELTAKEELTEQEQQDLEMILNEALPQSVKYIRSSVEKMDRLLSGLAELSRYGRSELQIQKLNMNALIANVIESFRFAADQAGIEIRVTDLPECWGDNLGINQVFSNIIGNAVKYMDGTRKGLIEVSGWQEETRSVYCVKDNGIGIPDSHKERIFDVFHRVDPTSPIAGEGLGLSAVKNILNKNNGKIWLESEFGQGSTFYIALPKKA